MKLPQKDNLTLIINQMGYLPLSPLVFLSFLLLLTLLLTIITLVLLLFFKLSAEFLFGHR